MRANKITVSVSPRHSVMSAMAMTLMCAGCVPPIHVDPAAMGPPQMVEGPSTDCQWSIGNRVFFALDRSDLSSDARAELMLWVRFLRQFPKDRLVVEGHADERGTRDYNLALGERRAKAVRDFLVAQGLAPENIRTVSYGKERPAVLGSNESAWSQNRRAVGVIE
jgi:peptidoglycan-associated lipoprotein